MIKGSITFKRYWNINILHWFVFQKLWKWWFRIWCKIYWPRIVSGVKALLFVLTSVNSLQRSMSVQNFLVLQSALSTDSITSEALSIHSSISTPFSIVDILLYVTGAYLNVAHFLKAIQLLLFYAGAWKMLLLAQHW